MIDQGQLFHTPNPCRSICTVNNKGFCKGCFRSREERFHWNEFSEYQKHLVVQLCFIREKRVLAAKHKKQLLAEHNHAQQEAQFDLFADNHSNNNSDNHNENISNNQNDSSDQLAVAAPQPQLNLFT